ncbi:hypothetical protein V5799_010125 [Amblyomma americanum]|uniref:Uncharacterized protein n=1 Tax=Amblyomma americanum TaxID=6943 RepID=A0AAQ4F8J0_AMBAM
MPVSTCRYNCHVTGPVYLHKKASLLHRSGVHLFTFRAEPAVISVTGKSISTVHKIKEVHFCISWRQDKTCCGRTLPT